MRRLLKEMAEPEFYNELDELLKDDNVRSKNTEQIVQYAKEQYPDLSVKDIRDWIKSKPTKQLRGKSKWNSFVAHEPRQEFQIDVATMSKSQKAQDMYMLVAVDPFTKFIFAEPMDSKQPRETGQALQAIVKKMGIPAAVMTDLGGEYQKDFEEELEYYDIQHLRFRTHPNFVERAIRTIKDRLRENLGLAYSKEDPFFDFVDWAPQLPHVLHEINSNTANRVTGQKPQDVVDEFGNGSTEGHSSLEDQEVLRKHMIHQMRKHAKSNAHHEPLRASEEDGSFVKVRKVQSGQNSIGRQTYGNTTYRVVAQKRTGDGPLFRLKVHSEDPDNPEDTKQILTNPSVHGAQPRYFPRHELMKVVDTVRSDKLAPFTNEEYEHRAEWATASEKFVELLQDLQKKKNRKGELIYPSKKIALSDPAITKWKKDHDINVSLAVFVKTFRDILQLTESYVILRDKARPVATLEKEPLPLDEKQREMRQKLERKAEELVRLIETETTNFRIRVSDPRVKEWFTSVAAYIKNELKDRQSGITKLSSVLVLYPDKFRLLENRTLISLIL